MEEPILNETVLKSIDDLYLQLEYISSSLNSIMSYIYIGLVVGLSVLFLVFIWTLFKRFIEQY